MRQFYRQLRSIWYRLFLVRRYPVLSQLTKFAVVGTTSFVIDLSIYLALTRWAGWYYLLANTISFLVAVLWGFLANRLWTFRQRSGHMGKQYGKFLTVSTGGLALATGLLYLLVDFTPLHDVVAKFVVAIIVMIWNFTWNKYWTFRSHD